MIYFSKINIENMILTKQEKQVVSKKRVADHGEVYTATREVNAMLDLVKQETERIDSRFLEPACGTGNFVAEVLDRKLRVVETRYGTSQLEYERYSIIAVSSIYGIDIREDNVLACRKRLLDIFNERYDRLCKKKVKDEVKKAIEYILERNIVWGDALTLKTVDEKPKPIVFSEWSLVKGSMIKRRDFAFHALLPNVQIKDMPLFSNERIRDLPEASDLGEDVFIPMPVKEFPVMHFLRIVNVDQQ
ncbi:MAG: SAM-dependent DNA methyltransferase [Deltaproteobacteria bacterium]|nr:SAM-dependent DNA methyltransferase [Deltaproteobacteria bacterium]